MGTEYLFLNSFSVIFERRIFRMFFRCGPPSPGDVDHQAREMWTTEESMLNVSSTRRHFGSKGGQRYQRGALAELVASGNKSELLAGARAAALGTHCLAGARAAALKTHWIVTGCRAAATR